MTVIVALLLAAGPYSYSDFPASPAANPYSYGTAPTKPVATEPAYPPPPDISKLPPALVWHTDYAKARAESRRTGKPIFIRFRIADCIWCDRLAAGPLIDKGVQSILRRFVCVALDGDSEDGQAARAAVMQQGYEVTGYPTLVMQAPNGTVGVFAKGYMNAPALRATLMAHEAWSSRGAAR